MPSSEESAIVEVIQAENRAFWMRDEAAYERYHLHSPDALRWGYWQGGGLFIRKGWDEIGTRSLKHMARLPDPAPELAEAPITNLRIHAFADMAWASYDREYPYLPRIAGQGPNGTTHNIRILEKHDGRWLIAVSCLLDAHLGEEVVVRVAGDGTVLWASASATSRLRSDEHLVLRLGRLHLRDRRKDAHLQDSIRWAVGLDGEFMPRRGAIPMFVEGAAGAPRLIWILADVESALVMLDDPRPMGDRISLAVQAFALSPAQARLAQALCEGIGPTEHARKSGISANTAHTHLKRMFEKLGVSSQAGLVRTLMSMSPPR